jgi:hypothetical protein
MLDHFVAPTISHHNKAGTSKADRPERHQNAELQ